RRRRRALERSGAQPPGAPHHPVLRLDVAHRMVRPRRHAVLGRGSRQLVARPVAGLLPRRSALNQYLLFLVLGIGTGALYAALAQGILVAYRGSGVVNLAQGAVAMYGAYTCYELHGSGRLFLPPIPNPLALVEGVAGWFGAELSLPDIPTFITLRSGGLPVVPGIAVSLVVAAALGYALHALVYRPLRQAPPLAKTVASVGVIIFLQATIALRFGSDARPAAPILPDDSIRVFDGLVKADRLWLAG